MGLTVLQDGSEQIQYKNPAIPIYVNRGDLKTFPDLAALCHWHEDVELLMPVEGSLSYNVNGKQLEIPEGDAVFVNTRHMHYGFSTHGEDCRYICLTFRMDQLCANQEIRNRYILPILTTPHLAGLVLHQDIAAHQPVLAAIRQIDAIHREGHPGFELLELSWLFQLWQALYAIVEKHIGGADAADQQTMIQKQMLEFIHTHYPERITLNDIAAAGGVCRTRCCRIFRQYLGRTPNDYLNSFRLEKGAELLRSTDFPITEIAGACGFNSASYFTELFTRQKGCSPKAYRSGAL